MSIRERLRWLEEHDSGIEILNPRPPCGLDAAGIAEHERRNAERIEQARCDGQKIVVIPAPAHHAEPDTAAGVEVQCGGTNGGTNRH